MNFLGMGTLELLVVLLIAFIFLGPDRMVEAARFLGKLMSEARRMSAELPDLIMDDDGGEERRPIVHRRGGPSGSPGTQTAMPGDSAPQGDENDEDGPVGFRRAGRAVAADEPDPPTRQDGQ